MRRGDRRLWSAVRVLLYGLSAPQLGFTLHLDTRPASNVCACWESLLLSRTPSRPARDGHPCVREAGAIVPDELMEPSSACSPGFQEPMAVMPGESFLLPAVSSEQLKGRKHQEETKAQRADNPRLSAIPFLICCVISWEAGSLLQPGPSEVPETPCSFPRAASAAGRGLRGQGTLPKARPSASSGSRSC